MTKEFKACSNCAYYSWFGGKCKQIGYPYKRDFVTGRIKIMYLSAYTQRKGEGNHCGNDAQYFKKKLSPYIFWATLKGSEDDE